jgi:plasmid stabilization system protein ParE
MSAFIVAPEAEEDIFHIWLYLLREAGLETANRIEREILEAVAGLADAPGKGHRRRDLTRRNVLFYRLYQYMWSIALVRHWRSSRSSMANAM